MAPDGKSRRPRAGSADHDSSDVSTRIRDAAWRCWSWRAVHCCGCGRPGDCLLTTPPSVPCDQPDYDVITLGLVPHPRETCDSCDVTINLNVYAPVGSQTDLEQWLIKSVRKVVQTRGSGNVQTMFGVH